MTRPLLLLLLPLLLSISVIGACSAGIAPSQGDGGTSGSSGSGSSGSSGTPGDGGTGEASTSEGGTALTCSAGNFVFCRCADRSEGTKQCIDGKSFGPCTCPDAG